MHAITRAQTPPPANVLVVEDDPTVSGILQGQIEQAGYRALLAADATTALEILGHTPVDLTLTDIKMPEMNGLELLGEIRRRDAYAEVMLITARSSVPEAVNALQYGAADYLEKPIDVRRLRHTLRILLERRQLRQRVHLLELGGRDSTIFEGMVARSKAMIEVFTVIERLARFPTTALITGESGTGKELAARALHQRSAVSDRPFVVCNCSAIPPERIEGELFGYVRGALPGADHHYVGLFERADGGTIFLDEVGELSLDAQVKLLRVLENREIRRVGAPHSQPVDIRVIAATNRDLAAMGAAGTFREDLYYRLNVGTISLPPLRERPDDLPLLCDHLLAATTRRLGIENRGLTPAALDQLGAYAWPGNVRELANTLERAVILARGEPIDSQHMPKALKPARETLEGTEILPQAINSDMSLEGAEREQIRRALRRSGGKRVEAARLLGLSRRTLYRKLDKYGIR